MLDATPGLLSIAAIAAGVVVFGVLVFVAIVSSVENEKRASRRAWGLAFVLAAPFCLVGILDFPFRDYAAGVLLVLTASVLVVLFFSTPSPEADRDDTPRTRIDERDVMFSRARLELGSARFEEYYGNHPDRRILDDQFRSKPGLLERGSLHYEPLTFSASDANFATVEGLWPLVDGEPSAEKASIDPQGVSEFITRWAIEIGAVSVGITNLEDYHLYSIVGRGDDYGKPVALPHTYAIALTVEMDKRMIDSAPYGPTVMESSQQYVNAGVIAVQIAQFIRNLGYRARAHVDGNYRVVCPLVARDAGLGEIGRIGLLMTPELGPRVRVSVVTTDLPLVLNNRRRDPTTIDFCSRCKKCAVACPSRAIPLDDRREIDGALRWRIDSEACYTYWCVIGTDCARCIKVCPYSHPNALLHNVIRRGVRRSSLFRRAAVTLDDYFYGKTPPPSAPPEWIEANPPRRAPSA